MKEEVYSPSQLYDIKTTFIGGTKSAEGKILTENGVYLITYYHLPTSPTKWGYEVYTGSNYVVGSNKRSWSANYVKGKKMPSKWYKVADKLVEVHKKKFGTSPRMA